MPKELVSKELDEFKTQAGHVLKLVPVPSLTLQLAAAKVEREFEEEGKTVKRPTYQIKNVAGEIIHQPLSEEVLEDPRDPDQTRLNRSAWQQWENAQAELDAAQGERQLQVMMAFGIECDIPEGWEDDPKWAYAGIDIPTDPFDRKVFWLVHVCLNDWELQVLQGQLRLVSMGEMVTPEQKALFRGRLRGAAQKYVEDQFDRIVQTIGDLGGELEVPGAEGGEGMGESA